MAELRERRSRPPRLGPATPEWTTPSVPDIAGMTPRAQNIAMAFYESGFIAGIEHGRRQAEAEQAALDRAAAVAASIAARGTDLATLAERRGEPDHAARIRARQLQNGLTA